ncbi:MAG: DUF2189 domain-containing protein [Rhodospirillaceae bacterium]
MTTVNGPETEDFMPDVARPRVRSITVDETSRWLEAGLKDFMAVPGFSLGYGAMFVLFAYLITFGLEQIGLGSLSLPFAAGFMLIAPLGAVLFYETSRRIEQGLYVSFGEALSSCAAKAAPLGQIGVVLLIVMLAWIMLALVIFAMFFGGNPPALDSFFGDVLTAPQAAPFLVVGTLVGGMLATVAFTVSAISLPMVLDRDVTAVTAMATSFDAVRKNPREMLGWGGMIAFITFSGMVMFFVGLAFSLPLIGYATWHAYKSLVE